MIVSIYTFQISMNAIPTEDLDHVSKSALTPMDPLFAVVKVAILLRDMIALVRIYFNVP